MSTTEIKAFFESLHQHKKYVLEAGLLVGLAPAQHQGPFDGAFAAFPHSGLVAKLLKPCVFFVEEVDEGGSFGE